MSKLKLNGVFFNEMHGSHGDAVVKMMHGRVFTSKPPKQTTKGASQAQLEAQDRFGQASRYASRVMRDPVLRPFYEHTAAARSTSPFAQAAGDFLRAPNIRPLDLTDYRGRVGDPIPVSASDDTGVVSVTVQIRSATNAIIEEGPATLLDQGWVYTGKTALVVGQPVTIQATAKDRPGNATQAEKPFTRTA